MKKAILLLLGTLAVVTLARLRTPDRYLASNPWHVTYDGLVVEVPCCSEEDIHAAARRVKEHGRGRVQISEGTYAVSIPIKASEYMTIEGNRFSETTILMIGAGGGGAGAESRGGQQ